MWNRYDLPASWSCAGCAHTWAAWSKCRYKPAASPHGSTSLFARSVAAYTRAHTPTSTSPICWLCTRSHTLSIAGYTPCTPPGTRTRWRRAVDPHPPASSRYGSASTTSSTAVTPVTCHGRCLPSASGGPLSWTKSTTRWPVAPRAATACCGRSPRPPLGGDAAEAAAAAGFCCRPHVCRPARLSRTMSCVFCLFPQPRVCVASIQSPHPG